MFHLPINNSMKQNTAQTPKNTMLKPPLQITKTLLTSLTPPPQHHQNPKTLRLHRRHNPQTTTTLSPPPKRQPPQPSHIVAPPQPPKQVSYKFTDFINTDMYRLVLALDLHQPVRPQFILQCPHAKYIYTITPETTHTCDLAEWHPYQPIHKTHCPVVTTPLQPSDDALLSSYTPQTLWIFLPSKSDAHISYPVNSR